MLNLRKLITACLVNMAVILPSVTLADANPAEKANAATITEFVNVVFNEGKLEQADRFLQKGFIEHAPWPEQSADVAGFKAGLQSMRQSFPDLHVTIERTVAQDDLLTVQMKMTGTQKGTFNGAPASNKTFSMDAIDIVRMKDGRITEHWGVMDAAAMAAQLGM